MNIEQIARVAHEVNRAYCAALGDTSQPAWEAAPQWQTESAKMGVIMILGTNAGPEQAHASWMEAKTAAGWRYGEFKDAEAKTHPCIVPYAELPIEQRAKDYIFGAVVRAIKTTSGTPS